MDNDDSRKVPEAIATAETPPKTVALASTYEPYEPDHEELLLELKRLDEVGFVLVWKPAENSPLLIRSVSVDETPLLGPLGAKDTDSPFLLKLGSYHVGKRIKLAWHVRAFTEVLGVAAFAKARRHERWKLLKTTPGPLELGGQWKDTSDFEV